ncbi:MAG TPA: aminotransferase class I/II-fold pyridoxal phosphate-dependent enzyme [Polyangiaceae bacterium]
MSKPDDAVITSTQAVHGGDERTKPYDAIPTPIVQTSTYTFENSALLTAFNQGGLDETGSLWEHEEYGRYGNPTCRAVEKRMASLEATEDAILFSSGMAAITTTILSMVKAGQHLVFVRDGYRKTREFIEGTLARFGVEADLVPAGDLGAIERAIRPQTRLIVSESPTNPYLSCADLHALAALAQSKRVKTLVDSTFATPVNCRPATFGIDLVVHSATKYLAGHNDVLAGVLCGKAGLVSIVRDMRGVLGCVCDPHAAFLVERGLKTLALRVAKQNETALAVARFLEGHARVSRVFYPGLESHADHAVAVRQMRGFGGVVSFIVEGGLSGASAVVDRARLPRIAPSFGGVESLIEQPAVMSFYAMTSEERAAIGIDDGLIRLSVGIEEADDLLADLDRALEGR